MYINRSGSISPQSILSAHSMTEQFKGKHKQTHTSHIHRHSLSQTKKKKKYACTNVCTELARIPYSQFTIITIVFFLTLFLRKCVIRFDTLAKSTYLYVYVMQ